MSRKIFNYDDLEESKMVSSLKAKTQLYPHTISACGCLFYKKKEKELLLISYDDPNWPNYDDFGGIVDEEDETVFSTICREVAEETNDVISEHDIKKILKSGKYKKFYNEKCKYFFILVQVQDTFHKNTLVFGNVEQTDNLKRKIMWIEYDNKLKDCLAVRLKSCSELILFLDKEFEIKRKGFPVGMFI